MVVTHQANRQGLKASTVGTEHTGESLGIMQVADTAITLNQTRAEYELSKLRIHVARARNQRKWAEIEVWQNLPLGQFAQHSMVVEKEGKSDE